MTKLQRLGSGLGLTLICLSSGTAYAQSIYGIGGSLWSTSVAIAGIKFSAGIQSDLNRINTSQPKVGLTRSQTIKPKVGLNRSLNSLLDLRSG